MESCSDKVAARQFPIVLVAGLYGVCCRVYLGLKSSAHGDKAIVDFDLRKHCHGQDARPRKSKKAGPVSVLPRWYVPVTLLFVGLTVEKVSYEF